MAKHHMNNLIDYKRLDKVNIGHNITEAFDFHDIVRVLLVKMLRRKHPNKRMNPIYTEHNPNEPNENYPDIWMKIGKDIYVWEIQTNMSNDWIKKITKQYEEVNLIIVDLNKVANRLNELMFAVITLPQFIKDLKKILEDYVI